MKLNEDFTAKSKLSDLGRFYVNTFVENVAKELPQDCLLLDAGAGECAYKKYFQHCNYKAADLAVGSDSWNYSNLDYIAPLDNLPIEENTFEAILCTQVLEHLEYPRECVKELYRVLKPGGKLYLTVPMAQGEHQIPYDFFRYTSFGLTSLLTEAGFQEIQIQPFGGLFTRWAYELPRAMAIFPKAGFTTGQLNYKGIAVLPIKIFSYLSIKIAQRLLLGLEKFDRVKNDPFGWSATAIKK